MPWKSAASEQELRAEFIQLMLKSERSVSALCKDYGIARKTAYKWKRRYLETGDLSNRSTRPKTSPSATPHNVVDAILQIRGNTKHWAEQRSALCCAAKVWSTFLRELLSRQS